ncbi:hypothetical protein SmJEL517_g03153 [Synchytrium microbalum]|uniref:RING-type domain-containing protein n=1 Tax=Synchytrium microbalum TaxID=1806994 RepID=A0A507C9E7_9FUNG|nr:uncharacterized protein SmJEL517_g03153 [Synchytrium microbalum]TPX34173.1 hypothetical protein SmJEL517_g03153 [Synchytrium microbalum]
MEGECCICHDKLSARGGNKTLSITSLPCCGGGLHSSCLEELLKFSKSCPYCRMDLPSKTKPSSYKVYHASQRATTSADQQQQEQVSASEVGMGVALTVAVGALVGGLLVGRWLGSSNKEDKDQQEQSSSSSQHRRGAQYQQNSSGTRF